MASLYQKEISEKAPGHDPRHIEGFMRLEHPCLDGLSMEDFGWEILMAINCIKEGGLAFAEKVAKSFGL